MTEYETGKDRFNKFVLTIRKLVVEEGIQFDCIIGAGNSGIIMTEFTRLIYRELGIECPRIMQIPYYRFEAGFKDVVDRRFGNVNDLLSNYIKSQLEKIQLSTGNALFVDEETCEGNTISDICSILLDIRKIQKIVIVVEKKKNCSKNLPQMFSKVRYSLYSDESKEGSIYNNTILKYLDSKIKDAICPFLSELSPDRGENEFLKVYHIPLILLGLPLKKYNNGKPDLTSSYLETAMSEIPYFHKLQEEYSQFLSDSIRSILNN